MVRKEEACQGGVRRGRLGHGGYQRSGSGNQEAKLEKRRTKNEERRTKRDSRRGGCAAIPRLRGPTRQSAARKRKSGRSGRDDNYGKERRQDKTDKVAGSEELAIIWVRKESWFG
jgi:hypothetical protein